jgi:hypothetical protein
LAEAPLHLKPITVYDPSCNGAQDYRGLAKEISAQEIPKLNGSDPSQIMPLMAPPKKSKHPSALEEVDS